MFLTCRAVTGVSSLAVCQSHAPEAEPMLLVSSLSTGLLHVSSKLLKLSTPQFLQLYILLKC